MVAVAAEYPSISFIGVDQEFDEVYENVATISFPEDKAGFLAGMLATMVSASGKVGAVCETSGIEVVWQYCEGFRAGALYEKDDIDAIDVTIVYRDSGERDKTFNDPVWGQEQILSLIEEGVDTMTGFGGNTAQGAFLTAGEKGILVIGAEEDLYYRLPDVQPLLVTSIIKDPSMELFSLVLLASQGEPISGPRAGQISYAPFRTSQFETDMEIKLNMEDALEGIRNGDIEINLPEKK
jgi:basic membrane protein A